MAHLKQKTNFSDLSHMAIHPDWWAIQLAPTPRLANHYNRLLFFSQTQAKKTRLIKAGKHQGNICLGRGCLASLGRGVVY